LIVIRLPTFAALHNPKRRKAAGRLSGDARITCNAGDFTSSRLGFCRRVIGSAGSQPEPVCFPARMETPMTPNEIIAKVRNLPAVSQAALKLVCLLDQPAVSNEDIVTVLKYDDVLTAKLLRACNSPYFGFEEKISSVEGRC